MKWKFDILFLLIALCCSCTEVIDDFSLNVLFAREAGMDGIVFFGDVPRLRRELRALGIEISGAEDQ